SVLFALRKERMDRAERAGSGIKFANAREVRQSLESVEEQISTRIAPQPKTRKNLVDLVPDDLPFEDLAGIPHAAIALPALRCQDGAGTEVKFDALPLSGKFPELSEASRTRIFALLPGP